jgi:hypothetical protein
LYFLLAPAGSRRDLLEGRLVVDEVTVEAAEVVARVAALDIGKSSPAQRRSARQAARPSTVPGAGRAA